MSHYDPLDLRSQDKRAERDEKRARLQRQHDVEDMRWLMQDKRGRRVAWRLLERTGVFRSSFTGNSETFFREGERNVGLYLSAWLLDACPEQYAVMLKENTSNERNDDDGSRNDH